jgi:hypothetical protein
MIRQIEEASINQLDYEIEWKGTCSLSDSGPHNQNKIQARDVDQQETGWWAQSFISAQQTTYIA